MDLHIDGQSNSVRFKNLDAADSRAAGSRAAGSRAAGSGAAGAARQVSRAAGKQRGGGKQASKLFKSSNRIEF